MTHQEMAFEIDGSRARGDALMWVAAMLHQMDGDSMREVIEYVKARTEDAKSRPAQLDKDKLR